MHVTGKVIFARTSTHDMASSVEDRLLRLIRSNPPPAPPTRSGVLEYFKPRLDAIGLRSGALEESLAPKIIHVAGTKGKGSTCAMVERILRESGLRTALFTSPHLVHPRERFRVCGQPVAEAELEASFDHVFNALEPRDLVPGFFSFLFLVGLHLFSRAELDVVILEVGLGGRLDATNIIERPSLCAVTLLDLDHTEFLGDTIEKIAAEKAGIFKPGVPVLVAPNQEPSALEVLRAKATEAQAASLQVVDALPPGASGTRGAAL